MVANTKSSPHVWYKGLGSSCWKMLEWILSSGHQQAQNLCKAVCFVLKALQIHQDLGKPWSQRGVQAASPVPEQSQPLSACRCPDLM